MDMDRPPSDSSAQNQATRPVLVIRIVLNNFPVRDCFTDFIDSDIPNDTLINRMFRKLELTIGNLLSNLRYHSSGI